LRSDIGLKAYNEALRSTRPEGLALRYGKKCRARHFAPNAEYDKMLSTTDGRILDVAFRGFYLAFFPDSLLLSDEGPAVEGHAPCIIYSCSFDSPYAYAGHPLQVGVPIVVITFRLSQESIQTGALPNLR
jgi:hypothetical protein